jgi:hypothetical protein
MIKLQELQKTMTIRAPIAAHQKTICMRLFTYVNLLDMKVQSSE